MTRASMRWWRARKPHIRGTDDMRITSRTRRVSVLLLSLIVSLAGTAAHAQYRASLQGTVTDPQGGVIPGGTATLVDKATNRTATTVTNENGAYVFNGLAPRPYTLEVELTGFKKAVLEDVRIRPEQANTLDVQLEI